jgi:hypothetical protein
MKQSKELELALNSYKKEVERLRNCSPDWKPIPLKEYIQQYFKKAEQK